MESSLKASRACIRCKMRKKKCDKKLHVCGRCTRLGLTCSYDEPRRNIGRDDQNVHLQEKLAALESTVTDLQQELKILRGRSKPAIDNLSQEAGWRETASDPNIMLQGITEHTVAVLEQINMTFEDVMEIFFSTVHLRLPVLPKEQLLMDIPLLRAFDGESELIRSTICLLVIFPGDLKTTVASPSLQQLYVATKSLFRLITSMHIDGLNTIRAGILLCYYEITQGWLNQAHDTLETCIMLIQVMQQSDMFHPVSSDAFSRSRLRLEIGPISWCLSLLQSYLHNMACDISARNSSTSRLPAENLNFSNVRRHVSLSGCGDSGGHLGLHYLQEKTAVSLVDQVYDLVFAPREFQPSQFHRALTIDYNLSRCIAEILGRPSIPVLEQAMNGAYVTCLWALLTLHCFLFSKATILGEPGFSQVSDMSLQQLLLISETHVQSLVTGVENGEADIRSLPLAWFGVLDNAFVAMDLLGKRPPGLQGDAMKHLLQLLSRNWLLPAKYSEILGDHAISS